MLDNPLNKLIVACRGLGLIRKGKRGEPGALLIEGNRKEFPDRLYTLSEVLDSITDETVKVHQIQSELAAEAIIAWMEYKGLDTQVPRQISDYVHKGKKPENASVMKLLREREQTLRLMGGAAPRKIKIEKVK